MKMVALGFANFRSIGSEPIILDLQKRINLLIGANNSGKSNVLEILRRLKNERLDQIKLAEVDLHQRDGSRLLELVVDVEATEANELPEGVRRFHVALFGTPSRWIATPFDGLDYRQFAPFMNKWLNRRFTSAPTENDLKKQMQEAAGTSFRTTHNLVPEFHVIPQFRQIRSGAYTIDGTGIVELLADWKAPEIGKDSDRARFQKVQEFLRELLDEDQIELDVSRTNPELIVERGTLRLPLKNYGTGVHELIILAVAVLAKENSLIGIEEPEIHLHPLLQKALLRFLIDKTSNNYVITTHSNAFLSRPKASRITHLWLDKGETKSRIVETPTHVLQVLNDLGIRAADILQANFVVWVEGPSDRIYLNRWISLTAPELVEGIDYSVMFYGGRLLSHLSLARDEAGLSAEELIKLLRINQNSAIVIDSDRTRTDAELNETKIRISNECKDAGILCWVTAGREIENYLTPACVAAIYDEMTSSQRNFTLGTYQKIGRALETAYRAQWKAAFNYDNNKPGLARRIVANITEMPDRLDLKSRIRELVGRIRAAN